MAKKSMLMCLMVALMATSIAEAQQSPLGFVSVNGTLYCTLNGTPAGTAPVFSGASLEVLCTSNVIYDIPTNATSNSNGVYSVMLFPRPNGTLATIVSNCRLFVRTSLSNCNPSLPSSSLVSNLQFVKAVTFGFLRMTYMVASTFTLQS